MHLPIAGPVHRPNRVLTGQERWHDNYLLHLVKGVRAGHFLIGSSAGTQGCVPMASVIGKVIAVADAGDCG